MHFQSLSFLKMLRTFLFWKSITFEHKRWRGIVYTWRKDEFKHKLILGWLDVIQPTSRGGVFFHCNFSQAGLLWYLSSKRFFEISTYLYALLWDWCYYSLPYCSLDTTTWMGVRSSFSNVDGKANNDSGEQEDGLKPVAESDGVCFPLGTLIHVFFFTYQFWSERM